MNLYLGEDQFELIHISGHTQDETIVYLPRQKVLFTGDNVCTLGIPNLSESSLQGWFEALKLMERLDIDVVVPGHGEVGNKDCIKTFHGELSSLLNRVKEKVEKGWTRDEVMAQVSYEDMIHRQYSPENSERSRRNVKSGIGRLYDFVVKQQP
jgi:glyoxylase-like metal-dependent hydrolase (beta-lactamase superfamily II)